MSIDIPPAEPGALITASFMNDVIDALEELDARLTRLETEPTGDGGGALVITGFSATTVREGDTLTIRGRGFGASQGSAAVTFDGQPPTMYRSWKDDEIVCVVPQLIQTPPAGGRFVTVEVTNFLTTASRVLTVKPREEQQTGSFEVELQDVDPDPITAATDNLFQFALTSNARLQTTAAVSAEIDGQSWTPVILDKDKNPLPSGQIPIAPQETTLFYVRVAVPSGTNQATFKLTANATASGVDTGTSGELDFAVGQFADPDKTFSLAPTGSQPPNALVGSTISAKANSNTDVTLDGEFSVAGTYEVTLASVPASPAGWQFRVESPAANQQGQHLIEISQQQIDNETDRKVSRPVTIRVRPSSSTVASMQLRLVVKRQQETKSRTYTFDVRATA